MIFSPHLLTLLPTSGGDFTVLYCFCMGCVSYGISLLFTRSFCVPTEGEFCLTDMMSITYPYCYSPLPTSGGEFPEVFFVCMADQN